MKEIKKWWVGKKGRCDDCALVATFTDDDAVGLVKHSTTFLPYITIWVKCPVCKLGRVERNKTVLK